MPKNRELKERVVSAFLNGTLTFSQLLPLAQGAETGASLAGQIVMAIDLDLATEMGLTPGTTIREIVDGQMLGEAIGVYAVNEDQKEQQRREWEFLQRLSAGMMYVASGGTPDDEEDVYDALTSNDVYLYSLPLHALADDSVHTLEPLTAEEIEQRYRESLYRMIFFGQAPQAETNTGEVDADDQYP